MDILRVNGIDDEERNEKLFKLLCLYYNSYATIKLNERVVRGFLSKDVRGKVSANTNNRPFHANVIKEISHFIDIFL